MSLPLHLSRPAAGFALLALALAGCGGAAAAAHSSGQAAGTRPASSAATLQTEKIGSSTVLATAKGFTVYWFGPDTRTMSHCNGKCAHAWPPVKGPAVAGPGVTGKLGTIKRADGSTQATFNGHPLYTFIADTAPGQANGNGVNAAGGLWHDVPAAATAAAAPSSPSGSGGGGYGY
ncbi:MAG: COG4315 family predicted lipoprotein [Streptosporangiaceae bacterium]